MHRLRRRSGRPLLAGSARLRAGALLACCAILIAALGAVFAHQATADRLDQTIDSPVITWLARRQGVAELLAAPGSPVVAAALSAVLAVVCLLAGRLNGAMLAAAAVPAADGLSDGLLKHLFHRTYLGILSYPSGHTTAAFALAGTVTVLLLGSPQRGKAQALRVAIPAVAFVSASLVAIAVIGMRFHYFTDTVAGAALGIGTVCGLALLLDSGLSRRTGCTPRTAAR